MGTPASVGSLFRARHGMVAFREDSGPSRGDRFERGPDFAGCILPAAEFAICGLE